MIKKFVVENDFNNVRFDRWFKQNVLDIPQGLIEKIIRKNQVKINKKKTKSSYRVKTGDLVEIFNINKIKNTEKKVITQYKPSKKEKNQYDNFLIEDNENFIVINKPSGIAVQSGTKSFKNIYHTLLHFNISTEYNQKKQTTQMSAKKIETESDQEKISQLSKGFKVLSIEKFEEGKFPRKLFLVKNKKI